jgi:FolB domain-containing protein
MIIRIKNLESNALIGIHEHEKIERQPLFIDLEIQYGFELEDLLAGEGTIIDYTRVEQMVKELVEADHTDYLEVLAHAILIMIGDHFEDVLEATVWLRKPRALKHSETVEVELTMYYDLEEEM